jgi:FkbM family methyltransferase
MASVNWDLHVQSDRIQIAKVSNFRFSSSKADPSHRYLLGKDIWSESISPFYKQVAAALHPTHIIDIGANYGATAVIAHSYMNDPFVVCVEPTPFLEEFINYNLVLNKVTKFLVLQAVCDKHDVERSLFKLNPHGTLDNRAAGGGDHWSAVDVPCVSLASTIQPYINTTSRFYIKIDVQGYEPNVIDIDFFAGLKNPWLLKIEFAPKWIEEAGFKPKDFLSELCSQFFVCQNPAIYGFKDHFLSLLINSRITASDACSFTDYVASHNRDQRGWCDLLIAPSDFGKSFDFSQYSTFASNANIT